VSHLFSLALNYVGHREYLTTSPVQQMTAPYSRVLVMHLIILGGGFLSLLLGAPEWTVVLMVLLKIALDLRLHAREHIRASARSTANATQPA
jgi:Family of unknown function (DUF6498)